MEAILRWYLRLVGLRMEGMLFVLPLLTLVLGCANFSPVLVDKPASQSFIARGHQSGSYLDGGSYMVSALTSDNRNLYIYVDRSGRSQRVVAFLNAIDLTQSPEDFLTVLSGMDSKYRSQFSTRSPQELMHYIVSETATEKDRKVFGLVVFLERFCAGDPLFSGINVPAPDFDCSLYEVNSH